MSDQVRILVGTKKAAFVYSSDEKRQNWQVSPPLLAGWSIYHFVVDLRDAAPRLYAAANHAVWGPSVARSDDGGDTWDQRSEGLGFPEDMGLRIGTVWHVRPGHESQPGVIYAGTGPGGLFRSDDRGQSWSPNDALNRHDYRPFWQPVAGGPGSPEAQRETMSLHSIEIDPRDPDRIYVSISGGGAYVTSDGGASWELFSHVTVPTNPDGRMFVTQLQPNPDWQFDPAAGFDMHGLRLDRKNPDRLWAQEHTGVFRSDDRAKTWVDVTEGLPSFHGFPVAVTKRQPDAVYVVPLQVGTDNFRTCDGQFAVYRTSDAGSTWERLTDGLPGPHDYQSAYREAMETDGLAPEGVYVGTSNGELYASTDGGDRWQRLPGTLPPILSVSCAVY